MPFQSLLSHELQSKIENFASNNDFVELYKNYKWSNDSWEKGFPDILGLEIQMISEARKNSIKREHILAIAEWGRLPNIQNIKCSESIFLPLFQNGILNEIIINEPAFFICLLQREVSGMGPTYLSKVLRFALPKEFGVIDTRITRVFGKNGMFADTWLSLEVKKNTEGKYYIPKKQQGWPGEYSTWNNILRFFANSLDDSKIVCPHPEEFVSKQLRHCGIWACADIEMALFTYASRKLSKL